MEMAIFCDQCGYQVTPLAATGPHWTAQIANPSSFPVRQSQARKSLTADDDSQISIAETAEMGAQPVHSPLQKYIPKELMAKLETARASGTMAGERRVQNPADRTLLGQELDLVIGQLQVHVIGHTLDIATFPADNDLVLEVLPEGFL